MKRGVLQIHIRVLIAVMISVLFFILIFDIINEQVTEIDTRENYRVLKTLQATRDGSVIFSEVEEVRRVCSTNELLLGDSFVALPSETITVSPSYAETKKLYVKQQPIHYPFFIGNLNVLLPEEYVIALSSVTANQQTQQQVEAIRAFLPEKNIFESNDTSYPIVVNYINGRGVGFDNNYIYFLMKENNEWKETAKRVYRGGFSGAIAISTSTVATYDCDIAQVEQRAQQVASAYKQKAQQLSCSEFLEKAIQEAIEQVEATPSYEHVQALDTINEQLRSQGCQTLY